MLTGPQNNNMNMLNEFEGITITTFKGLVEMQSRSLFSSQIWKEKYLIVEDGYMYFLKDIKHSVDESTTLKVEMEPNSGIYPEENLDQKAKFFIRFTSSKHDISLAFSDHAVRDNLLICLMTLMTQQFVNGAKVIPKRPSFYRKVIEKGFNRLTPTSNSFKSKQKNEKGATEKVSLSKDKKAYRKKSTGSGNMANYTNNDIADGGSTEQPGDKKLSKSSSDACGIKNDIKMFTEVKPVNDARKLKIDKNPKKQIKKEKAYFTIGEAKEVSSSKSQSTNRISKPTQTPFLKKQRGPLSRSESCNTYVSLTQTNDTGDSGEKILSTNSKNSDKKKEAKSNGSNLPVGYQISKQSLQSKKTIIPLKRSESANTILESRKIGTKVSNFAGNLQKTSVAEDISEGVLINNSRVNPQKNIKKEDPKRKDFTNSIGDQNSKHTIQPKRTFTPLTRTKSANTVLESKKNNTKVSNAYGSKNISKASISKESHSDLDNKKETLESRENATVKSSKTTLNKKPIEKDPSHLGGFQRSKLSIRSKKTPAPLAKSDQANIVPEPKKDGTKLSNGYRTKNLSRTAVPAANDEKALVSNIKTSLEKGDKKEDLGRKDTGHSVGYQKSEQPLQTNRKATPLKRSEVPNTIIEPKKNSTNTSNGYGTRKERPSFKTNNASRQPQEQYPSASSKQTESNKVLLSKTRSAQLKKSVTPLKKTESVKTFQTSSRSNLETKMERSVVTFV